MTQKNPKIINLDGVEYKEILPQNTTKPEQPTPEPKEPLICPITGKFMKEPKIGTRYWFAHTDGKIGSFIWDEDGTGRHLFALGNCFAKKEYGPLAFEKQIIGEKIKRIIWEENAKLEKPIDMFAGGTEVRNLMLNHKRELCYPSHGYFPQDQTLCFSYKNDDEVLDRIKAEITPAELETYYIKTIKDIS